jgi:hypothetical protein
MPMRWHLDHHGERVRVVDEDVLLAWFRDKLQSNVIHRAQMRKEAHELGLPATAWPDTLAYRPTAPRRRETQPTVEDDEAIDVAAHQRREAWLDVAKSTALTVGGPEYYALQEALQTETPACDGVTAFTDTSGVMEQDQREIMESICWHCPVLDLCRAFAEIAKPDGFWAGGNRRSGLDHEVA